MIKNLDIVVIYKFFINEKGKIKKENGLLKYSFGYNIHWNYFDKKWYGYDIMRSFAYNKVGVDNE